MINYTMMLMIMMLIGTPVFNDYVMVMIIDTPVPDNHMMLIMLLLHMMMIMIDIPVCLVVFLSVCFLFFVCLLCKSKTAGDYDHVMIVI